MNHFKDMKIAREKSVLFKGWWKPRNCKSEPNALFIFGDNILGKGIGGQAKIRNCINSFGIPTKKKPGQRKGNFFSDKEIQQNIIVIKDNINKLLKLSKNYDKIYFPEDGLGTGASDLQYYAPKTLKALNFLIYLYFNIDYTHFE